MGRCVLVNVGLHSKFYEYIYICIYIVCVELSLKEGQYEVSLDRWGIKLAEESQYEFEYENKFLVTKCYERLIMYVAKKERANCH